LIAVATAPDADSDMRCPYCKHLFNPDYVREIDVLLLVLGAALVLSGVSGALKTATEATTAVAGAGTAGAAANPAAGKAAPPTMR
jgi:hypothetical protein